MTQRRNQRAGVEDRWRKADGTPSAKDGNGLRWRARYVGPDGVEREKLFRVKSEAVTFLNGEIGSQVSGRWTSPERAAETFKAVAEKWIGTKSANCKPKTVAGYRSLLDTVIYPKWETTSLGEIRYGDLQVWFSGLSGEGGSSRFEGRGLSASRIKQAHQTMSAVLAFAVRDRYIGINPAVGVELPKKVHRLAVAAGTYRTLTFVLAYCGLRFGEAVALRVAAVDVSARRITVRSAVTNVTGAGLVEGRPKNGTVRRVPIPVFVADLLATEIQGRAADELVFPGANGEWLTNGAYRWVFDPAAEAIGEKGLTPHQLRHTCASLAISAGANVKVLQTMLGHKTASLTLDRYGHLFPDDLDRVAAALDTAAGCVRADGAAGPVGDRVLGL